jgi:hypothetical protein
MITNDKQNLNQIDYDKSNMLNWNDGICLIFQQQQKKFFIYL